jgi:hypothetical protein
MTCVDLETYLAEEEAKDATGFYLHRIKMLSHG